MDGLGYIYHTFVKIFFGDSDGNHMKQGNNVIKTFLDGISDDDINYTLDKFWNDSIGFHLKNCPFYGDDFIWRRKYIQDRNSHLWHQKYSLPFTKVLSIVACRVT